MGYTSRSQGFLGRPYQNECHTYVGIQVYNFICPLNFLKFAYKGLVWNPLHGFRLSI